jgi:acetyltransferase-like isoleucine patch superfamily enzyme
MPLLAARIIIGEDAFLGARAFVLPGVRIGSRSIIGACSVVTSDIPDDVIAAGNPCKVLRPR